MKFPRRTCLYCANDSDLLNAAGQSMSIQRPQTAAHMASTPLYVRDAIEVGILDLGDQGMAAQLGDQAAGAMRTTFGLDRVGRRV